MNQDDKGFSQFLLAAKAHSYAGGTAAQKGNRPNEHVYEYAEGEYSYVDTYYGSFHFIGSEVVSQGERPVWGMNYYGKMLIDEIPEGFSQCLRQALLRVSREAPYRGPELYRCGSLSYQCSWSGKLKGFEGYEIISDHGVDIYKLLFHGGEIA